jgi:hypothetical protein
MRCFALLAMVVLAITCGPSPDAKLPGYAAPTGGSNAVATGGTTNTGGSSMAGAGGITGLGGSKVVGTGGKAGAGGATVSGGITGSGGRVGADGGPDGTGGRRDAGGIPPGTGGSTVGSGGSGGSGAGGAATGGASGINDAAISPPDSAGNCLTQLIANNYVCGSTPPCSACKDNSTSKAAECQAVLDCLGASYPCTGNCTTECFNKNGGNGPVQTCVTALQTAACGATGCGVTLPSNGGG